MPFSRRLPLNGKPTTTLLRTSPAWLYPLLAIPGSQIAAQWYRDESILRFENGLFVAQTECVQRYLQTTLDYVGILDKRLIATQASIPPFGFAAVEVFKPKGDERPILSRLYVMPEHRRQGHATRLVGAALQDFPNLALDGRLTPDGANFFGYLVGEQTRRTEKA